MPSPVDLLAVPFMRTALLEVMLLAGAGGVLGTWIVLRRLAFFTHAVGAAVFPALVAAGPLGVGPQVASVAAGLGYAAGVQGAGRGGRDVSTATGLLLVASLGGGIVLASDVVTAAAAVDQLLFGTLLGVDPADVALSASALGLAAGGSLCLGRAWTASGFDPDGTRALAVPTRLTDAALLGVVAVAAVAAVPAVGALLVTSLFIVPAATARLATSRIATLMAASVGLAAAEGLAGLYLALALDVSPGPTIAVMGAFVYGAVAVATRARARPSRRSVQAARVAGGPAR